MFARETQWGPGLSGSECLHYPQIMKLIGEELAYWVTQFGIDGFRFDATNRLPWEVHERLADYGRQTAELTGKALYLLSEYAECEHPKGRRAPTGHQYTDQTGRYLMKMLDLSRARHVRELPADGGSVLRPMLKAARRGWWYPDVEGPDGGLRGCERATSLLWHHDWIGNRFGGERISHLISFPMFKALLVWQALGQWTPLLFMGTENYAGSPWFYFTGHLDEGPRNHTSAMYAGTAGAPVLTGGRFYEFAPEAHAVGLQDALAFSRDGTVAGIDWDAFRSQPDLQGRPYMDHARPETFQASKLDWNHSHTSQKAIQKMFTNLMKARQDARIKEQHPRQTQYKAWEHNERIFVMRRRGPDGAEFMALFNLAAEPALIRIHAGGIDLRDHGRGYVVHLDDNQPEQEWESDGEYSLWLDTNADRYGGPGLSCEKRFRVSAEHREIEVAATTALVYSRRN
jgi:1,4-alpha-glucan branching enzyme